MRSSSLSRDPDKYSPETTRDTSSGMTQKLWYLFTNPFMGDMITGGEFKLKEIKKTFNVTIPSNVERPRSNGNK